jgi:hypothetical protein
LNFQVVVDLLSPYFLAVYCWVIGYFAMLINPPRCAVWAIVPKETSERIITAIGRPGCYCIFFSNKPARAITPAMIITIKEAFAISSCSSMPASFTPGSRFN